MSEVFTSREGDAPPETAMPRCAQPLENEGAPQQSQNEGASSENSRDPPESWEVAEATDKVESVERRPRGVSPSGGEGERRYTLCSGSGTTGSSIARSVDKAVAALAAA
mmetsp:Transcript_22603/g.72364  ORF Transcript_22603/g.72364 Transcript_22603/m.72364 type:complete len:109 (-) Transcript_22603:786-1112(-)